MLKHDTITPHWRATMITKEKYLEHKYINLAILAQELGLNTSIHGSGVAINGNPRNGLFNPERRPEQMDMIKDIIEKHGKEVPACPEATILLALNLVEGFGDEL